MDNVDKNAIKSLAIPGWGEKSLNHDERSKLFFIAEASLWVSFLGSNHLNNSYVDNYMSFGSHHAGINLNAVARSSPKNAERLPLIKNLMFFDPLSSTFPSKSTDNKGVFLKTSIASSED